MNALHIQSSVLNDQLELGMKETIRMLRVSSVSKEGKGVMSTNTDERKIGAGLAH